MDLAGIGQRLDRRFVHVSIGSDEFFIGVHGVSLRKAVTNSVSGREGLRSRAMAEIGDAQASGQRPSPRIDPTRTGRRLCAATRPALGVAVQITGIAANKQEWLASRARRRRVTFITNRERFKLFVRRNKKLLTAGAG
jgi:hypothetical protein